MADTTTELEVLDQIVEVLGGQSGQYETVVPVLQQIKELIASGITDPESITEAVTAWLDEHPEATTTVQDGSITVMKLAQDVIELLDDKADIDGYYSQLTAGLAENLIGRGDAVPAEYLYRTAGGTADIEDGIATIDCIKGNTLVWNQLNNNDMQTQTNNGLTATNNGDGSWTLNGTPTAQAGVSFMNTKTFTTGHKILIKGCPSGGSSDTYFFYVFGSAVDIGNGGIYTVANTTTSSLRFIAKVGTSFDNVTIWPQIFDLTLMFGAGNEPATVEEFEAMFPLPYYPYSAPKMLPVDIRGIETVGFNLWDEEWEIGRIDTTTGNNVTDNSYIRSKNHIPTLPNTTYHVKVGDSSSAWIAVMEYDASKRFIANKGSVSNGSEFTTSSECRYVRFYVTSNYGTSYKGDICINLSWSGYRNGEYEEHWSAERPIDTSQYFPTGLKKVGDKADALYADHYDTVIGAVDLGTLTWTAYSGGFYSYAIADALAGSATNRYDHITCAPYTSQNVASLSELSDKCCSIDSGRYIQVKDSSYTDAADFTAAMSGVMLYYELAEPTTVPIDPPLNLFYKVSDFGTERIMVDETADAPQSAPVPMEVEYGINAIDTIRRLPTEYQSHKSMEQLTAALESSLGIDITETWDETDQRYEYEATPFEPADGSITDAKLVQTGGVLSRVAEIDGVVAVPLEMGNITYNPTGWVYNNLTTRVRVPQGSEIELEAGSVITLSDPNYVMYVAWDADGTLSARGWITGAFIAPQSGSYSILVRKNPESSVTVDEVLPLLSVSSDSKVLASTIVMASENLFDAKTGGAGYVNNQGVLSPAPTAVNYRHSAKIPVTSEDTLYLSYSATGTLYSGAALWLSCVYFDANGSSISYQAATTNYEGLGYLNLTLNPPSGSEYMIVSARMFDDGYVRITSNEEHACTARMTFARQVEDMTLSIDRPLAKIILGSFGTYVNLDINSKTLTLPRDCVLVTSDIDGMFRLMNPSGSVTISYADIESSAVKFVYSLIDGEFYATAFNKALRHFNDAIIAVARVTLSRSSTSLTCSCPWSIDSIPYNLDLSGQMSYLVDAINHRGYNTVAPENTLPAFKLSKVNGFDCVECDIEMTSDRVPVLLHDSTINRTARNADGTEISGTVSIGSITYEQALEYDFGIWKSQTYAGTKIPTFEQFIKLCRNLGLRAYIELKGDGGYTEQEVQALVDMVKQNGMSGKVSWISSNSTLLTYVKSYDPSARLGYVIGSVTSGAITTTEGLKTSTNEVFIDSSTYTDAEVTLCVDADIPLEIWTVNSAETIAALPSYVTGVTSDSQLAGKVLYQANV